MVFCRPFGYILFVVPVIVALSPLGADAQSLELLQVYQRMRHASIQGNTAAATIWARKALELGSEELGPRSADAVELNLNLAKLLLEQEDLGEAARLYRIALATKEELVGPGHPDLVPILQRLAEIATRRGELVAAEEHLLRALTIEKTFYGDNHPNVLHGLEQLAAVYRAAQRPVEADFLDAQAREIRSRPTVVEALLQSESDRGVSESAPHRYRVGDGEGESAVVRVFYGTDRARTGKATVSEFYGSERGDLEYGYLDVSIPATHQYGELESPPRYWLFGSEADPKKHIVLLGINPMEDAQAFLKTLRRHIGGAPSEEVFVFIHGYNVSFQQAAKRTAQLAYDLEFDGTPILYSWPSQDQRFAYFADEASVRVSARKLRTFLEDLVEDSGASRLHLIAHSMGNRALVEALEQLVLRRDPSLPSAVFDQVILAAPDIDIDLFKAISPEIQRAARRVTLYASANDKALEYSAKVHGGIPRAGSIVDNGRDVVVLSGLDTIDMSEVDTASFGHSYYGDDAAAMTDMVLLMWRGASPPERCGMYSRPKDNLGYWKFEPEECRDKALLKAAVLAKRYGKRAREIIEQRAAALSGAERDAVRGGWARILLKIDELTGQ